MRDEVTILCPQCRGPARFLRAWVLPIRTEADLAWFAARRAFAVLRDVEGRPHAVYRRGLGAPPLEALDGLPDHYRTHLPHGRESGAIGSEGTLLCDGCGLGRAGQVRWPEDAFYAVEHRGRTLWAWDRETALALLSCLDAPDRKAALAGPQGAFLRRVPSEFLTARAAPAVAARLRARLLRGAA